MDAPNCHRKAIPLPKYFHPLLTGGGALGRSGATSLSLMESSSIPLSLFLSSSLTSTPSVDLMRFISWSESSQTMTDRKWQALSCQAMPSWYLSRVEGRSEKVEERGRGRKKENSILLTKFLFSYFTDSQLIPNTIKSSNETAIDSIKGQD